MQHGFGPELSQKPTTYTCWCGFRSLNYSDVGWHIAKEIERAHEPRRLTTIPAVDVGPPAGIEVASTPHGDANDAVEIRMIVRESEGHYRHHMVLVHRASLPFLIEELEAHRLDKDADPCDACAAQTFAARLTDDAMRVEHTCPRARTPIRHLVHIASDAESLRRGGSTRTAVCRCGWRGPQRATLELAADDALIHEDSPMAVMTPPGDS
jgi:hypothetical protein